MTPGSPRTARPTRRVRARPDTSPGATGRAGPRGHGGRGRNAADDGSITAPAVLPRPGGRPRRRNPVPASCRRALVAVLGWPLRLAYRLRVEGLHHVPRQGPAILAPNHLSFSDSLFLALVVPRHISFVAKAEYFRARRTGWLFRATGQIPFDRGSGRAAAAALAAAGSVLAAGGVVGVYPEGRRSRDGRLQRGSTGPVRLAAASGGPLIPVGLIGTDRVQPVGRRLPRPFGTVTVRFGPPIELPGPALGRADLRPATDELMAAVAALSGQEAAGASQATVVNEVAPREPAGYEDRRGAVEGTGRIDDGSTSAGRCDDELPGRSRPRPRRPALDGGPAARWTY